MYKVGDEVLVKGSITRVLDNGIVFSCFCGEAFIHRENLDTEIQLEKTYSQGLSDAWELAKRIVLHPEYGGISNGDLVNMFGTFSPDKIFKGFTVEEALAKIEAYEKEKKIKPTDVVEYNGKNWVVTEVYKGEYSLWDGKKVVHTAEAKKVASVESIEPLAELLRQIGE